MRPGKTLTAFSVMVAARNLPAASPEPLHDGSAWETHRVTIKHPSLLFKPADLARARENISRHAWAQSYAAGVEQNATR